MAITLPLPVRVTAGLLATGWDTVRNLPGGLPALSVSIAGHAVRLSMRVQQEITQLAARGDEVLAVITSRPSEHPAWAQFDDEDPEHEPGSGATATSTAGSGGSSATEGSAAGTAIDADAPRPVARARFDDPEFDVDVAWVPSGDDSFSDDVETLGDVGEAASPPRLTVVRDEPGGPTDGRPASDGAPSATPPQGKPNGADASTADANGADASTADASAADANAADASGPAVLPGYDQMTLAQVRGRLRGLSPADVSDLLAHERAGAGRAPFLTLLTNRMATLEHEAR
jgi:hypothetical protein